MAFPARAEKTYRWGNPVGTSSIGPLSERTYPQTMGYPKDFE
ncbi:hypothetical protein P6U16_07430 [Rhizobium sp. 32-5/1]|nr:hypothetical protein [Rhizobium sp. 32-5/1]WEZ84448.1 hypothetical protein P6U16_07430 [Rhizobium sp. 32-5/1]